MNSKEKGEIPRGWIEMDERKGHKAEYERRRKSKREEKTGKCFNDLQFCPFFPFPRILTRVTDRRTETDRRTDESSY